MKFDIFLKWLHVYNIFENYCDYIWFLRLKFRFFTIKILTVILLSLIFYPHYLFYFLRLKLTNLVCFVKMRTVFLNYYLKVSGKVFLSNILIIFCFI